jgi:hypothetical protein
MCNPRAASLQIQLFHLLHLPRNRVIWEPSSLCRIGSQRSTQSCAVHESCEYVESIHGKETHTRSELPVSMITRKSTGGDQKQIVRHAAEWTSIVQGHSGNILLRYWQDMFEDGLSTHASGDILQRPACVHDAGVNVRGCHRMAFHSGPVLIVGGIRFCA